MENLKNDFTGTWICRNGKEIIIEEFPGSELGSFISPTVEGAWDSNGEYYKAKIRDSSLDLMERISEKDIRR